jgi:hypothetical protein
MARLDLNKLAVLITVIVLAILAVTSGYRLEIGTGGLKLNPSATATDDSPGQVK